MIQTGDPYNVAIQGDGFFRVTLPDGSLAYTSDGAFKLNRDGQIVTSDGLPLEVPFTIPDGTINLEISTNGTVSALIGGREQIAELGQIQLFRFVTQLGLKVLGRNLYTASTRHHLAIPSRKPW